MLVITWAQLLYISLGLILFYLAEVFYFLYKQKKNNSRPQNEEINQELDVIKRDLEFLKIRLSALTASVFFDSKSQSEVVPSLDAAEEAESPYAQAIRLAQQGADAPEVAITCGISRGEADLIVAIYRSAERS